MIQSTYIHPGSTSATTVEDYVPISTTPLARRIKLEEDVFGPVQEWPTMPSSTESVVNQTSTSKTETDRLRGKLLEIRTDISAARARERLVLQELETLGAPAPANPLESGGI